MGWPEKFQEQYIILTLGKSHKPLAIRDIWNQVKKETYCSKHMLPKSEKTFHNAKENLIKKDLIEKIQQQKRRGIQAELLQLTSSGRKIFNNIEDLYPILDLVPDFEEGKSECLNCNNNERNSCFKMFWVDLKYVLENHYNYSAEDISKIKRIKNNFYNPNTFREFIFWLIMYSVSIQRLKNKFKNELDRIIKMGAFPKCSLDNEEP